MKKNNVLTWNTVEVYLESIGILSDIDIKRVRKLFSQAGVLCPEQLKDIFISNIKSNDGKEQFKDLWLFSDNYLIEVLNFISAEKPQMDMININKNIQVVSVEAENFELLNNAQAISKLRIQFYACNVFNCDQVASSLNCNKLISIFNTYVKHNLVSGQASSLL